MKKAFRFANPVQKKFFYVTRLILVVNIIMVVLAMVIVLEVIT